MTKYLRYVIRNIEPLRIADDSLSQKEQTATLRYIPGSTIRGLVINSLAKEADFEEIKETLFSEKVRYLNAYPVKENKELLPSPKGFYEDKTEKEGKKEIQNILIPERKKQGTFKRAALGKFSYLDEDCIYYYNVETASDMKIKIDDKTKMFRSEYIVPNQMFSGYIAVEEESLQDRIQEIFDEMIILGNARSSGMGKCQVKECGYTDSLPYADYKADTDMEENCFMILLSHTVMRGKNGEYCGIDIECLQKEMGVSDLTIEKCSTSTVEVNGYNRHIGGRIPSVLMYEQGSVFRLRFSGKLTKENMDRLMDQGIGVRKNEGFGRILFLKDYEKIEYKLAGKEEENQIGTVSEITAEDKEVLKIAAKGYYRNQIRTAMNRYVVENYFNREKVSNSQLGTLESFTAYYQYSPKEGTDMIKEYLEHAKEKAKKQNKQADLNSISNISKKVNKILDDDLEEVLQLEETANKDSIMGISKKEIFSWEEFQKMKLQLITALIRYENKKEV